MPHNVGGPEPQAI